MAPGARSMFGAPCSNLRSFWKQMHCIQESTCDIVGIFRRPPQSFGAPIVIRHPGNCALLPPSLRPLPTGWWNLHSRLGQNSVLPLVLCLTHFFDTVLLVSKTLWKSTMSVNYLSIDLTSSASVENREICFFDYCEWIKKQKKFWICFTFK